MALPRLLPGWIRPAHFGPRGTGRRRGGPAGRAARARPRLEELEVRAVPSTFHLDPLVGRRYFTGTVMPNAEDDFLFSVNDPAAFLDVSSTLASNTPGLSLTGVDSDGTEFFSDSPIRSKHITLPFFGSTWTASEINFDSSGPGLAYRLALAADDAPGSTFDNSTNFLADVGRGLSTLTTANTLVFDDFIGYLDTSANPGSDLVDTYVFRIPTAGTVQLVLSGLKKDAANEGDNVAADLSLFRDFNFDGLLEPSEAIGAKTAVVGRDATVTGQLNAPGDYAIVVSRLQAAGDQRLGGSNYRLTVSYSVPDNAGNNVAAAQDLGALRSNFPKTVADYLGSTGDTEDYFKFSTAAGDGGPFVLRASWDNRNFGARFFRDSNGNGVFDSNDAVFGQADQVPGQLTSGSISGDTASPGTYFFLINSGDAPEGGYTLTISYSTDDLAGSTLPTAHYIGNLFGRAPEDLADSLSRVDTADIYGFSLTTTGTLTASFGNTAIGTDADMELIRDFNGNEKVDAGEVLLSSAKVGNSGESITFGPGAPIGPYFIRVLQARGTPVYHLTLTFDSAGNSTSAARNLDISGGLELLEYVGPGDATDFYRVSVLSAVQLNVSTSLLGDALSLTVLSDAGEVLLQRSIPTPSTDNRQFVNLPAAGSYFVQISAAGTLPTQYRLVLATAPVDNAGNSGRTARDVGVLDAAHTFLFTDAVTADPTGPTSDVDFYRFTLGSNGPYNLRFDLSGLSDSVVCALFRDEDHNSDVNDRIDSNDVNDDGTVDSLRFVNTGGTLTVNNVRTPGTYFLRINPFFTPSTTGYSLRMSATTADTAGNSLGTASNRGPLGTRAILGEFIGLIDRDDFYSFTVAGPGVLNGTLSPVIPGVFVEVIQDKNGNGHIDQGDVLASSATAINPGAVSASLSAAGTYFVHVFTTGPSEDYVLSLAFGNNTGTFTLTPPENEVQAGERFPLALEWTVPSGSWHLLKDVDLRLRNALGVLGVIRFHEADNTFSLFDPDSGQFGPAKPPGSDAVLSNRYMKVYLCDSAVKADSADSPSVTLLYDLELKKAAFGSHGDAGHVVVEAAATDDLGHEQGYVFGGVIDLLAGDDRTDAAGFAGPNRKKSGGLVR